MSLRDAFRRGLTRLVASRTPKLSADEASLQKPGASVPDGERARAGRWLEAFEAGRLTPPRNVRDAAAWDAYWTNHLDVGPMEQGFSDMMSSDPTLAGLLVDRGTRTVLCVGNGLSSEALAVALLGFEVTVLDISRVVAEFMDNILTNPASRLREIPGFVVASDGIVRVTGDGAIDPELCPPIHRSTAHTPRRGGSLTCVTGDLMEPAICPGPFDVIIERRTLQLFAEQDRGAALEALVGRLADKGTLISHQHNGGWRPGQDRRHYARDWLQGHGFVFEHAAGSEELAGCPRLASLRYSTG